MSINSGPALDASRTPEERSRRRTWVVLGAVVVAVAILLAGIAALQLAPGTPPANRPPTASFTVTPGSGDVRMAFVVNASASNDPEDGASLQVRWDWEDNGVWDTGWSAARVVTRVYPSAGTYTIRLEVRDSGGLNATATRQITVSPYPRELRLGVILSKTGPLSVFGVSSERAILLAVEEINSAGGVFGKPMAAFYEDDQSSSFLAATLADSLISTRMVDVIVGSLASSSCSSILGRAMAARVFQISGACTSPIFSNASQTGGWFARTSPSDALQGLVAAHHAYTNLSFRRMAVIGLNNPYGRGVGDTFATNFTRYGGTVTAVRYVDEFQISYLADLTAVMSTNPEAVYLATWPDPGRIVIREWYQDPSWRALRWLLAESLLDQAGFVDPLINVDGVPASVVQTFVGTAPAAYLGVQGPRFTAWAATYQSRWGVAPGLFDANFYDTVYLAAMAAQASGVDTGAGVRGRIREVANPPGTAIAPGEWARAVSELSAGRDVDYDGAFGTVNIDANGDPQAAFAIWGIDGTNAIVVRFVYAEATVAGMLP